MKKVNAVLGVLAVALVWAELAQAEPRLQINRLTGEATIVGTGQVRAVYFGAKSLEMGASDVLDNVGFPDLGDNDADDNSFSPPGPDGVADGEEYFRRNPSNLGRYVGFNVLFDSTVVGGPTDTNIGSNGFSEGQFAPEIPVVQPGGYLAGSSEISFVADLPHVLGIMFKPGNPNLTQASATQNLFFKYLVSNVSGENFDGQIVVIPEPCGLTLVAMGTLGALGACRRSTSKRTS